MGIDMGHGGVVVQGGNVERSVRARSLVSVLRLGVGGVRR